MDDIEAEGDSIDQAIENALKLLGVERDAITVEVLAEGKKGIFGFGAQKARVRAAIRDTKSAQSSDDPTPAVRSVTPEEALAAASKPKSVLEDILRLKDILRLMGFEASVEVKTGEKGDESHQAQY